MPKKPQDHLAPKSERPEPEIIYTVSGKEREKLAQLRDQAVMAQNQFFGVMQFIASREDIASPDVTFDQNSLTFTRQVKSE